MAWGRAFVASRPHLISGDHTPPGGGCQAPKTLTESRQVRLLRTVPRTNRASSDGRPSSVTESRQCPRSGPGSGAAFVALPPRIARLLEREHRRLEFGLIRGPLNGRQRPERAFPRDGERLAEATSTLEVFSHEGELARRLHDCPAYARRRVVAPATATARDRPARPARPLIPRAPRRSAEP